MQAIVIDPQSAQRVGFRAVAPPTPQTAEALIRVKANLFAVLAAAMAAGVVLKGF